MKEKPTMVVVPIEDWEEYQELKKKKEAEETRFAENLEDVDRPWHVSTFGHIVEVSEELYQDKNHLPTKGLAEGLLALIQLLSFRHDVWEKEGKPKQGETHWIIVRRSDEDGRIDVKASYYSFLPFKFKKEETAEWFLETHKKLLTEYSNKLIK